MRLYDVGKDHEESMCLISNVRLITRVYGSPGRKKDRKKINNLLFFDLHVAGSEVYDNFHGHSWAC